MKISSLASKKIAPKLFLMEKGADLIKDLKK